MGENSKIAWTHHTFNPWWGCQKVSAGCAHCYADTFAKRVGYGARLPTIWGGPETSRKIASEATWREPVRWNREAEAAGERRRVFCASMADVFEDRADLVAPRARLAEVVARTSWLDWLLLTKRPENAERLWAEACRHSEASCVCGCHVSVVGGAASASGWSPNVWIGTTVENQAMAEERVHRLLDVPAAVRFLSCEPLLGPLDLSDFIGPVQDMWDGNFETSSAKMTRLDKLHWLIVGGESGPSGRPFDLMWARRLRDQCARAGVAYFFKQAGAHPFVSSPDRDGAAGHELKLRNVKGDDLDELPEDLRVREVPLSKEAA